jgi:hypothetical protein
MTNRKCVRYEERSFWCGAKTAKFRESWFFFVAFKKLFVPLWRKLNGGETPSAGNGRKNGDVW